MYRIPEWRGFPLEEKYRKFEAVFEGKPICKAEDFPIVAYCPTYFCFGSNRPAEYFTDPAVMLKCQTDGALAHLENVDDDFIPYFMPWLGTGLLASAFGCEVRFPDTPGADPSVVSTGIKSVKDIARLKIPDPECDGLLPLLLRFIDYAVIHGDLPVGLSDMNSPLSTAAQICGYDNFFLWMYDEPDAIHELMAKVCEGFSRWTKAQKEHIGEPLDTSNGLQGLWAPKGLGLWVSDDDLVSISGELYREFVVPHYNKLFKEFGGTSLHYCGVGGQQIENFLAMEDVVEINNSPLGRFDEFSRLVKAIKGKKVIGIQDIAPIDPDEYYAGLFSSVDSPDGMIMILWVCENIAMNRNGASVFLPRDVFETANTLVKSIRSQIRKLL